MLTELKFTTALHTELLREKSSPHESLFYCGYVEWH